ncbi:MAG TPA: VanW family protein [Polyangiaceae bacterium]|nr:VanW family protein [Polyangiaceae bacterium]
MRVSGVAFGAVLASALAGAGFGLWPVAQKHLPEPTAVTLGGSVPAPGVALSTWLGRRADLEAAREVLVHHPDGVLVVPREALGLSLDVDQARAELVRPRVPSSLYTRLRVALGGLPPPPVDVEPHYRLDAPRAAAWLADIAPGLRREAVDARLDLAGRARIEGQAGRELDTGASLSRLAALGAGGELTLAFTELQPRVATSALVNVDPTLVLSEYETDFAKRGGPRVKNIAKAASYLDGTVLAPGEVWSFNRTVGPRTLERGFVDAPVIVQDELEPGVGGGVCQVATTLFAAGVMGGLDVVKRRSHSRPSGYAPLGLDATVIDGEVDLQLRNPYPVPIIVHAFLPVPTRIRVEMLGAVPPGKVDHTYAVLESEDFFRRIARHPELLPDQVKRHQKGIPGYKVVSTVRTRYVDGSERVRRYSSTYYPVPEIFWVGKDVDVETLPALPERATHTELQGDGDAVSPASFSP